MNLKPKFDLLSPLYSGFLYVMTRYKPIFGLQKDYFCNDQPPHCHSELVEKSERIAVVL